LKRAQGYGGKLECENRRILFTPRLESWVTGAFIYLLLSYHSYILSFGRAQGFKIEVFFL
jgi:hypothetical protein